MVDDEQVDVFGGFGVPIRLKDSEDFLKIVETLSRIGVSGYNDKKLYQSCHILHKRGEYAIMHFKELFSLDNKPSNISITDIGRRNTIANLLSEWGLLEIIDPDGTLDPVVPVKKIKILSFREKPEWELIPKYNVGRRQPDSDNKKI